MPASQIRALPRSESRLKVVECGANRSASPLMSSSCRCSNSKISRLAVVFVFLSFARVTVAARVSFNSQPSPASTQGPLQQYLEPFLYPRIGYAYLRPTPWRDASLSNAAQPVYRASLLYIIHKAFLSAPAPQFHDLLVLSSSATGGNSGSSLNALKVRATARCVSLAFLAACRASRSWMRRALARRGPDLLCQCGAVGRGRHVYCCF